MIQRAALALLTALTLLVAGIAVVTPPAAEAAVGSDFDAGNIISDTVFFDSSTMTADQIQQFLALKGASCAAGTAPCLKDYVTTTSARPAEAGLCSGYVAAQQTAAQIIAGVAQSCGINPRVLLVLLEKEQSLVTKTRPTTGNYQTATGYGCPDTAACNSQYYGLFNQLYLAARQYQLYAAHPSQYGYQAGRTNTIAYSPNASCGTTQVFLVNQATAGLYNYTPYVPNAAALANLYGTGDGCSSYGNRNFWRLFTDWFGSTQANTFLMRTVDNATVYLVSGTAKYPIASLPTLAALSPLGAVGFVSQQYLDHHTTGPAVGRSLLGPDGTVYFFDAGIRLPFSSCAQVADFGMSCSGLVSVEAGVIASLVPGPRITNLYRTTSGNTYYIQGGQRHEAADDASLLAAGLPTVGVTLQESGVSYLPLGTPIVRSGVVVTAKDANATAVSAGGMLAPIPPQLLQTAGLSTLPRTTLQAASMQLLPHAAQLTPVVQDPTSGTAYLLTTRGKLGVDDAAAGTGVTQDTAHVLALVPAAGTATSPILVKTTDSGTVYLLRAGALRPLRSWSALVAVAGSTPTIQTIPAGTASLVPPGPTQFAPGSLAVAPGNGTVYLIDGLDGRLAVGSFSVTNQLGATSLTTVSADDLSQYQVRPGIASIAVSCGSQQYLGLAGHLYAVPAAMLPVYLQKAYQPLDPLTCTALPQGTQPLNRFLRTPDGTIYYMDNGQKRPIMSFGRYLDLGGTAANTLLVTSDTMAWFPAGAPA